MTLQWIKEESQAVGVGALDTASNQQAKALLASWNVTDGNNCISGYGLQPTDVDPNVWVNRDGWVLSCFTNWWITSKKTPPLPQPGTKGWVGWVDLDQLHLYTIQKWGIESGTINTSQATGYCEQGCQIKYANDPANLVKCLTICGVPPQSPSPIPPPSPPPPPAPAPAPSPSLCPPGQVRVNGVCQPSLPAPPCPTGTVLVNGTCQPALGPPPQWPGPPAAPKKNNAGVVLGVLAALGLVGLVANAMVKVPRPAMQGNPRKRTRSNPTADDLPIANPCDAPGLLYGDRQTLFYWSLGAYGNTHVYTWADSYESAEEEMLEWVDDHAPGLLSTIGEAELRESADELGIEYDPEDIDYRIIEHAEVDMIIVGHTTLKHGNAIPSWEVHVNEVHGPKREAVKRISQILCEDEGPLPLPEG